MELEQVRVNNIDIDGAETELCAMIEEIKRNHDVYKIIRQLLPDDNAMRRNIALLYTFYQDFIYCANCPGFDQCQKDNPHYELRLVKNGNFLSREISPCPLLQEKIKQKITQKEKETLFVTRDFPREWLDIPLAKISRNANVDQIIIQLHEIVQKKHRHWLYIKGASGTGKSFMALKVADELVRKGFAPAAFLDVPKRCQLLQDLSINDPERFAAIMERYQTVPLLILDDLGNEFVSELSRDTIIFSLLSRRAKDNLLTIITSPFSLRELQDIYARGNKIGAGMIKAGHLVELIKTMSENKVIDLGLIPAYK